MAFWVGVLLALSVSLFARASGLDRDRAFYPTVLAVVASCYDLFGVMGGSMQALLAEVSVTMVFLAAVVIGFKRNLWIIVAALFVHGAFDFIHAHIIPNPGVPDWWPMFCLAYDATASVLLAGLLQASAGKLPWISCTSMRGIMAATGKIDARPMFTEPALPLDPRHRHGLWVTMGNEPMSELKAIIGDWHTQEAS